MTQDQKFIAELQTLFEDRIIKLKALMEMPGSNRLKMKLSRRFIESKLDSLCSHVTEKFNQSYFKQEINKETSTEKTYPISGRGNMEKKALFKHWLKEHFDHSPLLIYLFFDRNGRCLYVGKTGRGGRRPLSQFDKHWAFNARSVVVYEVKNKSQLPKLECLATHYYEPRELQKLPSQHKWTKACPMCAKHQLVIREVNKIFPLKQTRKR